MIELTDLDPDSALTLTQAAALIGSHTGRRPSASTCWRWALRGIRGKKLEVIRIGGLYYTTRGMVEAFLNDLPRPSPMDMRTPPARPARTTTASEVARERRQREQQAAKQHLDRVCSPKKRMTR